MESNQDDPSIVYYTDSHGTKRQCVNPYARSSSRTTVTTITTITDTSLEKENFATKDMGGRSQQRKGQRQKKNRPEYQEKYHEAKKIQKTLTGEKGHTFPQDCIRCMDKLAGKIEGINMTHKGHHDLCPKKKHKDPEEERLRMARAPPTEKEKLHGIRTFSKSHFISFFKQRHIRKLMKQSVSTMESTVDIEMDSEVNIEEACSPKQAAKPSKALPEEKPKIDWHTTVANAMDNTELVNKWKKDKINCPMAFCAVAQSVAEHIFPKKIMGREGYLSDKAIEKLGYLGGYFDSSTLGMRLPCAPRDGSPIHPHYHMIEGQMLLLVCWEVFHPHVVIHCPDECCSGRLKRIRTKWSNDKSLFPIYQYGGPSIWAMIMIYQCVSCSTSYKSNSPEVLHSLPFWVRDAYPVDPQYIPSNKNWHLHRSVTDMFGGLMPTYGNGDLIARMIYEGINKSYIRKAADYYSYNKSRRELQVHPSEKPWNVPPYPTNPTEYCPDRSPTGDEIRDLFEASKDSEYTLSGFSDYERLTREIQSVGTKIAAAQDHTSDAAKNYQKKLGCNYIWDVAVETGEIACAVLVKSTKAEDLAHAAEGLARRPNFNPKVLYCDTWPHNKDFWEIMFGPQLHGRLGLYHFQHRIVETLRQGHRLYHEALRQLCFSVYDWHEDDFAALVRNLKVGRMGRNNEIWTDEQIDRLNMSKTFKDMFGDYLRKKIHPPDVMRHKLQVWFETFAHQKDPLTYKHLFTSDTKSALEEQIKRAQDVTDTLPIEKLYKTLTRGPKSTAKHSLLKKKSLRCESHLESFHLKERHFANTSSRQGLADYLSLLGTCRHNVTMRHRAWWNSLSMDDRVGIIQYFAKEPMYYNHSELSVVNQWAVESGCDDLPFKYVRPLPPDNGERFFGAYAVEAETRFKKFGNDRVTRRCLCPECSGNPRSLVHVNTHGDETEDEDADVIMPVGTRFADKPSKDRPFRKPKLLPTSSLKPPPIPIAPQPSLPQNTPQHMHFQQSPIHFQS